MKKILLSILSITTLSFGIKAQQSFEWANIRGGTGPDYVTGITSDNQGNTYNVGFYQGVVNDFDPDTSATAVTTIPFSTSNDYSVYIQKLAPNGTHIWTKTLDSQNSTSQRVGDITIAPNGDLLLCGAFKGGVDFDMGVGSANILSHNSGSNTDGFILRLTQNGDFVWVKTFGLNNSPTDETRFLSIDTDSQGNIFVSGHFSGSTNADPNGGFQPFYTGYDKEGIVIKLNSTGAYQWAHEIGAPPTQGGNLNQIPRNIMVDSDDNVWITADIQGDVVYSGFPSQTTSLPSGFAGIGILKVNNATGVPLINMELLETSSSTCVAMDLEEDDNGNIYLAGWFNGTLTDGNSQNSYSPNGFNESYFTASYHKNGGIRWLISPEVQSSVGISRNYSVAYSNGTVTIGGFIKGDNFDADPSVNIAPVNNPYSTSGINRMSHIITYDTLGYFLNAGVMGAKFTYSSVDKIHVDVNDNIYLIGNLHSSENKLDPINGTTTDIPTNGSKDIFLVKLGTSSVGVSEIESTNTLSVYPNPATSQLTIDIEKKIENIIILDVTGKAVKTIASSSNTIDISDLVKGIYFLQVQSKKGLLNSKFIKK